MSPEPRGRARKRHTRRTVSSGLFASRPSSASRSLPACWPRLRRRTSFAPPPPNRRTSRPEYASLSLSLAEGVSAKPAFQPVARRRGKPADFLTFLETSV